MRIRLGLVVEDHLAKRMGRVVGFRQVSDFGSLNFFDAAQTIWAANCSPEGCENTLRETPCSVVTMSSCILIHLITQKAPMVSFRAGQPRRLRHTLPYTHQASSHHRFWLPANITKI